MATDRDRATLIQPEQFSELIDAVRAIATRATITTTVAPGPLDESATKAVGEYNTIAQSLRTIFEQVATTTSSQQKTQA